MIRSMTGFGAGDSNNGGVAPLLSATVSFLYRNFLGQAYQQVPGFTMPSVTSIYGIRWSFIN